MEALLNLNIFEAMKVSIIFFALLYCSARIICIAFFKTLDGYFNHYMEEKEHGKNENSIG